MGFLSREFFSMYVNEVPNLVAYFWFLGKLLGIGLVFCMFDHLVVVLELFVCI